jgi:4-hydroxy-2-oxoheptanedioate aldolase
VAGLGFDYVTLDAQHGLIDYRSMVAMLIAISSTSAIPIVRVPSNDPATIGLALDAGARAVIVPMVETAEQASAAVAACRYAPDGIRSYGALRANRLLGTGDPSEINERVFCFVMIETQRGVAAAREICSTPGLAGVYIGPADLAVSLSVPLGEIMSSEAHHAATRSIVEACRENDLIVGHHGVNGAHAKRLVAAGHDMVTVMTDSFVLVQGAVSELTMAKSE